MSGIIKGDLERALGFKTMKIGGVEIDLSQTKAKDLIEFQKIPSKYLVSKEPTNKEYADLSDGYREYFINYIMDKDPSANKEQVTLFVVKYINQLVKEFPVATGLRTKEEMDKIEEEVKKKSLSSI